MLRTFCFALLITIYSSWATSHSAPVLLGPALAGVPFGRDAKPNEYNAVVHLEREVSPKEGENAGKRITVPCGTGIVIGTCVLTARHVVSEDRKIPLESVSAFSLESGERVSIERIELMKQGGEFRGGGYGHSYLQAQGAKIERLYN